MTSLFDRIIEADGGIRPQVPCSSLHQTSALSASLGLEVLLKADHLLPTGSFKIRGATNKIRVLGDEARANGVVTASTGNHGQAVALAGKLAGVAVTVYVNKSAAPSKLRAIEALGATLVVCEGGALAAEMEAQRQSKLQGKPYVAPYNDLDTIAGQGTCGVELLRQAPDLDAVFVCVGGGGLISGIGAAIKHVRPNVRIVGVWPEASTGMLDSLRAGRIVATPESDTLSDGSTGEIDPGAVTFPLCQQMIDEYVTVSELEIAAGMRRIAEDERWIIEGTAGVAVAGLMKTAERYRGQKVVVQLCGRNVDLSTFIKAMAMADAA